MKKEKTTEAAAVTANAKAVPVKTGQFATQIFVFFSDPSNGDHRGLTQFASKADLDVWLKQTNVQVLRVFRGREKTIASRIVFQ